MKRPCLLTCLAATLFLLPRVAPAQSAPAQSPPAAAEKPAAVSKSAVQSNSAAQNKPAEKPTPAPTGQPAGAAFVDLDKDGDMDILLVEQNLLLPGGADGRFEALVLAPDNGIGAIFSPADDTLRAQLKLTKGQGLVVTAVKADSPAAKAGLQVDDLLLSAGDRPLAKPSDVSDVVNSPVKKPFTVEFDVVRGGERRKVLLTVTDQTATDGLVELALALVEQPSYRIGVELSAASPTLRNQLKLPKDQGTVITQVLPDSPALKAGFQNHDVLLTVNGKPLKKAEDLSEAVKSSEGKPLKFAIVRAGQRLEITVTPEKSEVALNYRSRASLRLLPLVEHQLAPRQRSLAIYTELSPRRLQPAADTSAAQIERMLKQIDELRASVKSLQGALAKEQKPAVSKPSPSSTDLPKGETPKK